MCGICGKITENCLCKKCEKKLFLQSIFGKDNYKDRYFENHFYLFKYDGQIREKILDYKFNDKPYIFKTFVKFFEIYEKNYLHLNFYDIIIPVPISKKRFKTRGYNQSTLLAKEIAKYLNTEYSDNILKKVINNNPQSILNQER